MFSDNEQLKQMLKGAKNVLICFGPKYNIDALAGALALKSFLTASKKQTEIVCDGYEPIKNIKFLSQAETIKDKITNLQKLVIKVDLSDAKIDTLSYDIKDNWLSIYLNPKSGSITKNNLRTAQTSLKYDLIITINIPDLDSIGETFFNNSDMFYSLPIINIDCQSGNEHYGQLNFCDLTASSNCEIIYDLIKECDITKIDANIASAILTGMIAGTKSFKTAGVTPHILNKAGELMELGAKRDDIIRHLYHTKTVATLKLWGKALVRIKQDYGLGLVWTVLTTHDFIDAGANKEDLQGIIDELISNSPEAKMILLLYEPNKDEGNNKIYGVFATDKGLDAREIIKELKPEGSKQKTNFEITNYNLAQAEEKTINIIKNNTKKSG